MIKRLWLLTACCVQVAFLFSQTIDSEMLSAAKMKTGVRSKRVSSYDTSGKNNDRLENIGPGQKKRIFDVKGSGIINHIWLTIAPGTDIIRRDDIVIRMYWDGNKSPSVISPLGSFFGQGWNEAYPLKSQPLYAAPGGSKALVCYFTMPFRDGAVIEIENQGDKNIEAFYYYVDYYEVDKLPIELGRFHAWFNRELTKSNPETKGENEWDVLGPVTANKSGTGNYLIADIKGKGQFVGLNYYVHCPTPMWYGEGDDMIYIDGSKTPVLSGTGTEDYFNTSWSPKTLYQTPQFGAARVNTTDDAYLSNGWLGRTHVYRFHISDPIYFDKSLRFTIEHGHNNNLVLDLRTVAYWYQSAATAVPEIAPLQQRQPMPMISPVDIHKWRDAWRKANGNKADLWGNDQ
jgi:D-arabinan exo alpha-(1,3)/(1,5)-arabinofuranosidase (non-reducing end)